MRLLFLLFFILILSTLGCSKEQLNSRTIVDCPSIAEAKILPQDDLPCSYTMVYSFKGEIYTRCVCCVCFKWAQPIDCEGQVLCELPDDCWEEFQAAAEYLYAVEEI